MDGCSKEMEDYFRNLLSRAEECYKVANAARRKNLDPENEVEIPMADDLASTVEKLLKYDNISEKIRALSEQHNREEVAILIGKELAKNAKKPKDQIVKEAVRAGLAILTEGRCCAPLEGVTDVKIGRNHDGTEYVSVYYAGPIRSAGGTAQAMSVLIADVARRELGLDRYKPTKQEIERYKEEIPLYKQCAHLQYTPTAEEIELIVSNCPICIDGEGTENVEITGHRNLPRIATNKVRGGACLIIAEGLTLKSPKIQKHVRKLGISGWEFIDKYCAMKTSKKGESGTKGITPSTKYMEGAIAGRPILSHPMRAGGFRLRYGRTRTTGLAAIALHPATLFVLDEFLSVGSQLKLERPGKAGAVSTCTSIEPPIVLLKNGDLVEVDSVAYAIQLKDEIKKIIDVGEILVPLGEFLENNHPIVPGAYAREWWIQELKRIKPEVAELYAEPNSVPDAETAISISSKYGIPLHPAYNLFWHDVGPADIEKLSAYVCEHGEFDGRRLMIPADDGIKNILINLGATHVERCGRIVLTKYALPLICCLGLEHDLQTGKLKRRIRIETSSLPADIASIAYVSALAGFPIRERAPTRIGAKLGRPNKAAPRKMNPASNVLFPVSEAGGPQRLLSKAIESKTASVEINRRICTKCAEETFRFVCRCGSHTKLLGSPKKMTIDFKELHKAAFQFLGESHVVGDVKCVKGLISKNKVPEPLEKGILRAKHDVYVFKDGTCRFDLMNLTLTHFRPSEIGITVEQAIRLGYKNDYMGEPLRDENQILELKCQDIVPCHSAGIYLVRVAQFIDEMLVQYYKMKPFYGAQNPEDLIGHVVIGLSPHTSGGVLARIIGYTNAHVGFAHPYFHASKRRNADGDEDCIMLLLDALINFSHSYLPESRGGLMDAPLVLSTRINPNEIDKEAHNVDIGDCYPLEVYEAGLRYAEPKEIEPLVDNVAKRIGKYTQYESFRFTHNTDNIALGPDVSHYQKGDMSDKLTAQLNLQTKNRAVDENDAASRLIKDHFIPDMMGNLRTFATQSVRCTKCSTSYRRVPLTGICTKKIDSGICGNNLTLTVHESSVKKYLEKTKKICEEHKVADYVRQQISVIEHSINTTFQNDKIKKCKLDDFFERVKPNKIEL